MNRIGKWQMAAVAAVLTAVPAIGAAAAEGQPESGAIQALQIPVAEKLASHFEIPRASVQDVFLKLNDWQRTLQALVIARRAGQNVDAVADLIRNGEGADSLARRYGLKPSAVEDEIRSAGRDILQ